MLQIYQETYMDLFYEFLKGFWTKKCKKIASSNKNKEKKLYIFLLNFILQKC
jgi:hypothetical protein